MALWDAFSAQPGSAQAIELQGLLGGLTRMGGLLAQAGAMRPLGQPAPNLGDAFMGFGEGRRQAQMNAYQTAEMERKAQRQTMLQNARSDKPDEALSARERAMRAALASMPGGITALADDDELPRLAIQREAQRMTPIDAARAAALGLRPGTVAFENAFSGAPSVLQQPDTKSDEAFRQALAIAGAGRQPQVTWRDERDAQGNLIGQRSSTGQFNPINAPGMTPGQAMNIATRLAPGVRDGTIRPGSPEWDNYVGAYTTLTKPTTQMVPDPRNPGQFQQVTNPAYSLPADAYPHPGNVMMRGQGGQPPPPTPQAEAPPTQAAPAGVPIPGSGGQVAEPPPPSTLPRAQDGTIRATPQAVEQVRKGELEAARVADAIANYRQVLKEVGAGFNTWVNNPMSPEAQRVLQAYERVKMVMRGEALFNTGVLQPGENVMLEQSLLSPHSARGAVAPLASHEARLKEIEKQVLDSYNASRKQVGLPPIRSLSGVGAGAAAGVSGTTGGATMRWNPQTGRVEPVR